MKPKLIQNKIEKLAQNWVGEKHIPSLIRALNKTFEKSIMVFESKRFEGKYYPDHSVIIGAQYSPYFKPINLLEEIVITLHFPKDSKMAIITKKGSMNLQLSILRAIHHEYRHKAQHKNQGYHHTKQYKSKATNKKIKNKMNYFGSPDELDAHAYETQIENTLGKLNINRLRVAHRISWKESESVYMYRKNFRVLDPKVWKKFLKKVYKNNL